MSRLAIFGAEGLEGERLIELLSELEPGFASVIAVVADDDADVALYQGRPLRVEDPQDFDFSRVDIAVFLKGGSSTPAAIDAAEAAGVYVIDASDYLAQRSDVPLIGQDLAVSDAATLPRQLAVADVISSQVAALLSHFPAPQRVTLSVNQPVSALGRAAVEALAAETARLLNGLAVESSHFSHQLAFNCVVDDAAAREIEGNLAALLGRDAGGAPEVLCQVATVPVFHGHSVGLVLEYAEPLRLGAIAESLVQDSRFRLFSADEQPPTPVGLAEGECIDIAAISSDRRNPCHIRSALVADNLRKGVILNIIALLKILIKSDI